MLETQSPHTGPLRLHDRPHRVVIETLRQAVLFQSSAYPNRPVILAMSISRPRCAHHREALAAVDTKVDLMQDGQITLRTSDGLAEFVGFNDRLSGGGHR